MEKIKIVVEYNGIKYESSEMIGCPSAMIQGVEKGIAEQRSLQIITDNGSITFGCQVIERSIVSVTRI